MSTVIGLSGSLRRGSYNSALLRLAVSLAPAGCQIEIASIREIPLYDGDVDAQGQPAAVVALKEKIAAADGLLLATPEYNYSLPGVLKNAIDWLSRPARDIPRVFGGRAVGVIGTGGPGGTRLAQAAWLPVFRGLQLVPYFGKQVFVPLAAKAFDADGNLVDETARGHLDEYMKGFGAFVAATRRS
jgi:chromate reductase, NAD(P)H dehydrogenase (quinone)